MCLRVLVALLYTATVKYMDKINVYDYILNEISISIFSFITPDPVGFVFFSVPATQNIKECILTCPKIIKTCQNESHERYYCRLYCLNYKFSDL